ncbi:AroM family protein [Falsiroseomonas sp. E2-1-a20]|uniref:AroM family protein n=1 Tax=Falsiroseomonas sp. E2-1-a20 TaxID=3239300 RepID=UPI003F327DD6
MAALPVFIIGQAPRHDLVDEIAAAVPGLQVALRGALDGLSRAEVADCAPRDGADTLFTVLPSGEGVTISKLAVTQRLRGLLEAVPGGALLACTGAFKGLPERPSLVQPSAVLNGLAHALLPRGRLGLFVPLAEQAEALRAEREREGLSVAVVALRPHGDDAAREAAMRLMAAEAPDLVLLDCISYTRRDKAAAVAVLSCPVLLSVAVAARAAASLLPEA